MMVDIKDTFKLKNDTVKEQADSKIIFTTSISNIRVLTLFATYVPRDDIILWYCVYVIPVYALW